MGRGVLLANVAASARAVWKGPGAPASRKRSAGRTGRAGPNVRPQ